MELDFKSSLKIILIVILVIINCLSFYNLISNCVLSTITKKHGDMEIISQSGESITVYVHSSRKEYNIYSTSSGLNIVELKKGR